MTLPVHNTEPCFWTSTSNPNFNAQDRERWITVQTENGPERRREKHPQRGHHLIGNDINNRVIAPGERWILVVRHDGHEIRHCVTNAAAQLEPTSYTQYAKTKARALGWYPPGVCPCALLATGELKPEHIVDKSLLKATPCTPGSYSLANRCKHSDSEKAARQAVQAKKMADLEAAFKTKDDKVLETMQKQLEASQKQTEALTAIVNKQNKVPRVDG